MLLNKFIQFKTSGQKGLAVLIDPDKADSKGLIKRIELAQQCSVDFIFLGGSMVNGNEIGEVIDLIRAYCSIPVVLFPGSSLQLNEKADAVLFLSLISGRNPEYLIGNHVTVAPYLKKMGVEVLPTGYMLVDGGVQTTASYISNSTPLPNNKPMIAQATALAGEMLGMKLIYMDAGSGAMNPIAKELIESVAGQIDCPLIVGGGITNEEQLLSAYKAGADIVVVGNAIEQNAELIERLTDEKLKY
ncbi:MAG: geranylgeranylglyceryl/heptaprenylglyceryl phosphate synthase [Crocinitomicaceae bacterium]|nr:geranylgeranylglyceryl/heptaprenylglyceryl phosphate synthase [Crocinitomicaceae bacterium]|tara:strand:+ start:3519 stop:4253 length:735 start_codon:yes stop_codon:yes gene_type:complete